MSDQVWTAIIAATPPTLTIVAATWLQNRRADKTATVLGSKVDEVHQVTNSRLTEALVKIEALQRQLGQAEGK